MSIEPRRIQHFRIALSRNTVELPWASRAPLLAHVRRHDHGLQVVLAVEACTPAVDRRVVQVYVSELRKVLGDGVIQTRTPGYVLVAARDAVDLGHFERLVRSPSRSHQIPVCSARAYPGADLKTASRAGCALFLP